MRRVYNSVRERMSQKFTHPADVDLCVLDIVHVASVLFMLSCTLCYLVYDRVLVFPHMPHTVTSTATSVPLSDYIITFDTLLELSDRYST